MIRRFFISIIICFLLVETALALMPPEDIAAINLEAKLILIGEVTETGKILLPEKTSRTKGPKGLFVLKVLHVVKGFGIVSPGEQVTVIFRLHPKSDLPGIFLHLAGGPFVEVKAGNIVVAYINPSDHPEFYKPVAEGSSVVIINQSQPQMAQPQMEKVPDKGKNTQ